MESALEGALMPAILRVFVAVVAVVLSACTSSLNPVGLGSGPVRDDGLLGGWRTERVENGQRQTAFLFLVERSDDRLDGVLIDVSRPSDGWYSFQLLPGRAGAYRFANVTDVVENSEPKPASFDGYMVWRYEIAGDRLRVFGLSHDKTKNAVASGQLAGRVMGEDVTITAGGAALDAFFARNAGTFFEDPLNFERLDPR
jgi:hypothetical protein